jgi:hypothetical protein
MRRLLGILALALLVGSVPALATIEGSPHDLSSWDTGGAATGEVCIFCHTPHNANTNEPLWNHSLSGTASFTIYTSATMNATETSFANNSISGLCMSCHDGATAITAVTNASRTTITAGGTTTGNAALGTTLSDDHPVGITYGVGPSNGGMVDATTAQGNGIVLFGTGNDQVECSSCHDVHEWGTAAAGDRPFLIVSNNSSDLCQACHGK